MKRTLIVAGIGLAAGAVAAVLLATFRLTPAPHRPPLRLTLAPGPQAERTTRQRCVRLGWKAPYWYAGPVSPQSRQPCQECRVQ
jgi:hypothetical protein